MDLLWKERKRIWCGLPLTFTVYSYDNERFYVKSGFLNQRQDEVRLYRIQDLTVTRSLSQRIFGMGTILVNSSEYSCAITPQVRQAGNRLSGLTETAYASLLA